MGTNSQYDAEDAANWRRLIAGMENDTVRVVMLGDGPGAAGRDAGMYASDIDDVLEHLAYDSDSK